MGLGAMGELKDSRLTVVPAIGYYGLTPEQNAYSQGLVGVRVSNKYGFVTPSAGESLLGE
jgi:hypothetical protein